jgi:hypothetical protein
MLEYNDFSACIGLRKCFTRVRGGGFGRNAWIAKIIGTHPKYKYEREFCDSDENDLSRSGRSGTIRFTLQGPGLYEFRNFCIGSTSRNWEWSGFVLIDEQDNETELSRKEVDQIVKNMVSGNPNQIP